MEARGAIVGDLLRSSLDEVQPACVRFVENVASALASQWSKETKSARTRLVETTFRKEGSDIDFAVYVSERCGAYRLEVDA